MPIGNVSRDSAPKRETFRPPWVKDKDTEALPSWTQKKLKPVESTTKAAAENDAAPSETPKPLKPVLKKQATVKEKAENGLSEATEEKLVKPSVAKQTDKTSKPTEDKPKLLKTALKSSDRTKSEATSNTEKLPDKPILKSVRTIDDKAKEKSVSIVDKKTVFNKNDTPKINQVNDKNLNNKSDNNIIKDAKKVEKQIEQPKVLEKVEEKQKMATKPPLEKTPSKLPPRKPSLQKAPSKDDVMLKKWRDPLHERVKENIDKTLANEIPKGHTLTKNESLRNLLKPTPPPMPPPPPPKLPPPPDFKKAPVDPAKLKKLEDLRSRPRKRPDWSDMMKEVEQGKKLKHVVCNDRSKPIITTSVVVKNKDQFIFESEKPNSHNELLKEINKGIKLKKVKCNDRSKPNLEGLRKFRRQMTIEEQLQKSMSQANLTASPSGVSVAEAPAAEENDIDEMDDIDKVRDDLQSTKQLLAIELRNKEAQERENKRLLTRIQNLEAELARERAIIKQEQHKTVISVTDAYDERLVNNLKMEVEKAKETADNLQKQYLLAAEERDDAQSELEELKRKNSELEKKLEQALSNKIDELLKSEEPLSFYQKTQLDFLKQCRLLNLDAKTDEIASDANNNINTACTNLEGIEGVIPSNVGSRRSSHAIKQLSVTKDDSFEEEEESDAEEEETEEKKQKRLEKEIRNMRNKIRHLKEKQDNMKRERMGYKMALKNQQSCLKEEKRKFKELKREVDKMAAMMKEVGTDEEDEDDEEEEESEEEKKSGSEEEEETETETEQDTESETESESEPEDAPLPKKKDNLAKRLKRHETRVNALKKGNTLLMANVDRLKDDVLKQREQSCTLQKELDSLIDDLE
ncbi:golgin subfamily B member 1 isoform X1 [Danaus plexippus]|uniref:golgin subfamily B member 1 isoform X1 n=1 Tax=Danaus plexippus TaxID=13037 RepID=UPI000239D49D|nr:golgin subfamily B member 1 isoform X1 [Danaus plexippus]XP_032527258.1 golgin subfamily B member 1 isoform X1 [Danaus plexippus]